MGASDVVLYMPSPAAEIVGGLLASAERGDVFLRLADRRIARIAPGTLDLAGLPVFDIRELQEQDEFRNADVTCMTGALPFPECLVLFSNPDTGAPAVVAVGDQANATHWWLWMWNQDDGWFRHQATVSLDGADATFHYFQDAAPPTPELRESVGQDCLRLILPAMVAMALLHSRSCIETQDKPSERLKGINKQRIRERKKPVFAARVLSLNPAVTLPSRAPSVPTGREVQPHWRRAHTRTLPSGKKVPVKATAIKGGGISAPVYTLVA